VSCVIATLFAALHVTTHRRSCIDTL